MQHTVAVTASLLIRNSVDSLVAYFKLIWSDDLISYNFVHTPARRSIEWTMGKTSLVRAYDNLDLAILPVHSRARKTNLTTYLQSALGTFD